MLPPIVLQVEPNHYVIDLCAAPGSKTGQILEFLSGFPSKYPSDKGFVIAN